MDFWESVFWVAGIVLIIFALVEFKKDPDVITVFQRVFTRKYLIPWAGVIGAFIVLRLVLIAMGPILKFIFSP